jgi:glycosyltransferase involved in cell wall biosynthesis
MKVWLLTIGEPLPIEPGNQRLHRTGLLANVLAKRGIDVVWWTSTFRHAQKDKLFDRTTSVQVNDRLKLWCLDARPYRRNISIERILSNREIAAEFWRYAMQEEAPDAIVASYPIPELAAAGATYARQRNIPSIVDVRDLWPDIWSTILPRVARPLANAALLPFYRQSHTVLRSFHAIAAITDEIVDWGVQRAGRARTPTDRAFPLAYPAPAYSTSELKDAKAFWADPLATERQPDVRICFFGNLGAKRGRLDVMIEAIRLLPEAVRSRVQLVVCGVGQGLDALRQSARHLPQIVLPGWVDGPKIHALAMSSSMGALPFANDKDFVMSIPNKAIEYLAYGLPILTSLSGPVSALINAEGCGLIYRETDPHDMARAILDVLERPDQLRALSDNAARVYRERFLASEVYGRYADLIVELARR